MSAPTQRQVIFDEHSGGLPHVQALITKGVPVTVELVYAWLTDIEEDGNIGDIPFLANEVVTEPGETIADAATLLADGDDRVRTYGTASGFEIQDVIDNPGDDVVLALLQITPPDHDDFTVEWQIVARPGDTLEGLGQELADVVRPPAVQAAEATGAAVSGRAAGQLWQARGSRALLPPYRGDTATAGPLRTGH